MGIPTVDEFDELDEDDGPDPTLVLADELYGGFEDELVIVADEVIQEPGVTDQSTTTMATG